MPFTLTMPKLSPTMEEGTIVKWHKQPGDHVDAGDVLIEVSTDKATVEHQALDGGWLRQLIVPEGGQAIVNQPIAIFTEEKEESIEGYQPEGAAGKEVAAAPVTEPPMKNEAPVAADVTAKKEIPAPSLPLSEPVSGDSEGRILASPLAKKLAAQRGLDLSAVKGSGPGGRIMQRDLATAPLAVGGGTARQRPRAPLGSSVKEGFTPMRKVIAQRLQEAKATIPHFYVQQTIDASPLIAFREQLKNGSVGVTFNDLIIKASALALKQHPAVNTGYAAKENAIVRFNTVDIAVAVSIEGGLITPIVRYADDKDVREISREVKALSKRAKEGKLQPEEFQGGSFTISNLGMLGITNFYAIINPPQAAILAVAGIVDSPVVKNGQVVSGKTMNLSLSVDHRIIDGVAAAEFMRALQKYLENPALLLLND